MRLPSCIATATLLAWAGGLACAQALSDPTRPPSSFYTVAQAGPGRAQGGLVLESVLISESFRSAIISGEHVMLGQKIGELRLVRVGETEVVLLEGGERKTLKLFPGVEKRPAGSSRGPDARR